MTRLPDCDWTQSVPGIVGVLVGCPGGCGETIPVLLWKDAIDTPPASGGVITATVRIDSRAMAKALVEHYTKCHSSAT